MSNDTEAESKCFKVIAESAPPLFQNGKIVLQAYHIGWIISGAFTLIAVIVSFWLIGKHLQWYTNKREQRYIVRLLFMVPLYAVISFASFLFWNHSTPIILIRDAYEAIVLTAFFYLLLMYLSHDPEEQKRIFLKAGLSVEADNIARKRGQDLAKWVFPLGFVHWKPKDGLYFLQLMKWGVLQYCVIRPTSTLAAVILNYLGLYCEDSWGVGWGHIYITIVMSVSVTIAMYCLLQLYVPVAKDLSRHQPLLKLFSVKAVVFLTFWQATFLSLLSMFGLVKDTKYMTADDINNAISAILETFEMMLFAFLHIRAFTYKPYCQPSDANIFPSRTPQWRSLGHAMDFRETFREIWIGCIYMFDSMRGKEPTPDFGVIREVHYQGAFGRQRPLQSNLQRPQVPDHAIRAADLTFPPVEIEVNHEVEVVINGKREWLLLEKLEKPGAHMHEKDEGLQEQIDRELAKRGYARLGQNDALRGESTPNATSHSSRQRSWWRSIYDRISQTEREPEKEKEAILQIRESPSSFRASHRPQRSSAQYLNVPQDIDDQPPQGILHAYKSRPAHIYEGDTNGRDYLPLSDNDLREHPLRYEDRPILCPTPSRPHGSKRDSRPSRSGAGIPVRQLERSSSPSAGGANGPISRPRISSMPQSVPPQSSTQAPVPLSHYNTMWQLAMRNVDADTNLNLVSSSTRRPPVPPKDLRGNSLPEDGATSRQHRKSAHLREAAGTPQDRHNHRVGTRTILSRYSALPMDDSDRIIGGAR